jgi:effector-binding domain-containing protein
MEIKETSFGPKRYLTLKRSITTSQITDKAMYEAAGKKLGSYLQQRSVRPSGPWSVLYFLWDETAQRAEIGIAFPVEGLDAVHDPELTLVDVPEGNAAMATLRGPYADLGKTHQALMQYVSEHKFNTRGNTVMAIEEYIVDTMSDPNPANWVTHIYYPHN